MYLKEIEYCNVGPLESVKIIPAIIENNPKPLILVGENGSGKSTFLSNIIDSFYEIAGIAFSNVRQANEDTTKWIPIFQGTFNVSDYCREKIFIFTYCLSASK